MVFTKFINAMNYIKRKIQQISEKGIYGTFYILYLKIARPILKLFVRYKFEKKYKSIKNVSINKIIRTKYLNNGKNESELIKNILFHNEVKFFFNIDDLDRIKIFYRKVFKNQSEETIKKADQIVNNDFQNILPGYPIYNKNIKWHKDLITKNNWPLDFYMDLDITSNKYNDIRLLWEINRHQYFVTLGKAYLISGDEKYTLSFLDLINDWIKNNPCGFGINWLHSQESSIRMISWIWAMYFFWNSPKFNLDNKKKILQHLFLHAEYTYSNLSNGLITHNHLITEICGLTFCAFLFPEFKNSKKWLNKGLKIFKREIKKQIWEDGPSAELSTNYHLFVLESFLQLFILLKKNNYHLDLICTERIEKMIDYVMSLCKSNGDIPKIGDNDSGRIFRLTDLDRDDRRALVCSGAILFDRDDFKSECKNYYEETFWLLGIDGYRKYSALYEQEQNSLSKIYKDAGIVVLKHKYEGNSINLFIKGGPTNHRKNVSFSHNHSDFLSFELEVNGNSYLIDPGTYLYNLSDDWRFYFRKTFCHNTIVIDGEDQFEVSKTRFGIPKLPLGKVNNFDQSDEISVVELEHNCYNKINVIHKRKYLLYKSIVIIVDEIIGEDDHQIEQNFNSGKMNVSMNNENKEIKITNYNSSEYLTLNHYFRNLNKQKFTSVKNGWYAPRYGELKPANIISTKICAKLPIDILTILNPSTSNISVEKVNIDSKKFELIIKENKQITRLVIHSQGKVYVLEEEEILL